MRKVGSIYLKGQNKENVSLAVDIPTRRKESMDATSVHTQASYKEASGYQIKSTSINSRSCSQCNSFDQAEDTLREQYHTFGQISMAGDSCFDSLDVYCQSSVHSNRIFAKLQSLQSIFKQIKMLRSLQMDRRNLKELSAIENAFLDLQRQFIKQ